MSSTSRMVRTVSIAPAMYIQVAGGLNLAALKKPSVAGSVNLPTTWGMKNSAQVSRSSTTPFSRLNLSAHDMRFPRCVGGHFNGSGVVTQGRASPSDVLDAGALQPVRAQ